MNTPDIPVSTQCRALVDCDSFFAWCEVARHPELRGQCVCVGREEDIIVASTYEAKARWVKTGTPAREAKRILGKDIVLIKPDMHYYQETSKKIMTLLAGEANDIEVYSVDEAFIDITHHLAIAGNPDERYAQRASAIQHRIRTELGISVSIGVAPTRILAKICAWLQKPFGIVAHTTASSIHRMIEHMPLTTIPFISHKRASRLPHCHTVRDFLDAPLHYIQDIMGGSWTKLRYEMHGTNAITLKKPSHQKMIERTRSFHPNFTSDKQLVRTYLMQNFERAYRDLITSKGTIKTLRISFRLKNFRRCQQVFSFPWHTADREILLSKVKELFELIFNPRESYRTTGITLSDISYITNQPSLFEQSTTSQKIYQTIDKLNEKFGKVLVTPATNVKALESDDRGNAFG